jgi:hypothetical protein
MSGRWQLEARSVAIFSNSERRHNGTLPVWNKRRVRYRGPQDLSRRRTFSRDFESRRTIPEEAVHLRSRGRVILSRPAGYRAILCAHLGVSAAAPSDRKALLNRGKVASWRKVHLEYLRLVDSYRTGNRSVGFFASKNTLRRVRVRATKAQITRAVMVTPYIDLLCFNLMAPKLGRFIIWTGNLSAWTRPAPCVRAAGTHVLRSHGRKAAGGGPERWR